MPITDHVHTESGPTPGGAYSQAVVANGFVFTAGFGPQDPATGIVPEGIAAQTRQVLANIEAVLAACGLDLSGVVRTGVHLADLERDFAAFNEAYTAVMPAPYPVRTTVGSHLSGILVEIDAVAAVRS